MNVSNYKSPHERSSLLISFCNFNGARPSGLLYYQLSTGTAQWVTLGHPAGVLVYSGTGIGQTIRYIFHVYLANSQTYISILDKQDHLRPVVNQQLLEVSDPHSIAVSAEQVFVVSTGTDEVLSYQWSLTALEHPTVLWNASDTGIDLHHVNSVALTPDKLVCSAFGPRSAEKWSSAQKGYIFSISDNKVIKDDIYHPHSTSYFLQKVWYCESSLSSVHNLDGLVCKIPGYLRGLASLDENTLLIGSSVGRHNLRNPNVTNLPSDTGPAAGTCAVTAYNIKEKTVEFQIEFGEYGQEIYDIAVLETVDLA